MNPRASMPWPAPPRPAARGFTLIEIMISMAILGMVLTSIYSTWTAILRSARVAQEAAARVQHARMAMRALTDAFLCVQYFASSPGYYAFEMDTSAEFAYASFVARLPSSFPASGLFGGLVIRRVTFTVERGDESPELVMYQMPLLAAESESQKPFAMTLAKDVSLFELDFWNPRANDWTDEWTYTNQLPKLVRITLGLGKSKTLRAEPQDLVTRIVAVPAIMIPREYQFATPMGGMPGMAPGVRPNMPTAPPAAYPGGSGAPGALQPPTQFLPPADFTRPGRTRPGQPGSRPPGGYSRPGGPYYPGGNPQGFGP